MADIASMASGAAAAGNKAMVVGWWAFVVLLILAICGFMLYRFSFNCKVRIHYLTNGQDQLSDKRGKVVKDRKDGLDKLLISMGLFRKLTMPSPPPEATSLDLKGKRCFMVEFGDDGSQRYIVRKKGEDGFDYIPLSTNDRVFYLNEDEKRLARQKKGLSELIAAAIPYIALVIILGMLLAFWGEVVEPMKSETASIRAHNIEMREMDLQITGMLKEIIKREQVVPSEPTPVNVVETPINKTPPPDV